MSRHSFGGIVIYRLLVAAVLVRLLLNGVEAA
jgi:hypothetical protein